MKTTLLDQIKKRRLALRIKIQDMSLLAGLTRQQYGKIEASGNPRLNSLDQIAEGLEAVLVLVPKSKLHAVEKLLASEAAPAVDRWYSGTETPEHQHLNEDDESPWGPI